MLSRATLQCLSHVVLRAGAGVVLATTSLSAVAQTAYPVKPITIVVPFATGGSTDLVARMVGQAMSPSLGQTVVVDNRLGGGGAVGWASAARAAPDGYTLLTTELSYAIAAGLNPNLAYDPKTAFSHIGVAISVPHVLAINPGVPAKTVKEFIALAKAQPGKLNYGSGGVGTNTHLGSELLKSLTGIYMVHIPYKGAGAVLQDLMAGEVQALVTSLPTAMPHIKAGKLRALMVTGEERSAVLPDVPPARDVGLPQFVMTFWAGLSAPAGTPAPVIDRLNKEMAAALNQPDTKRRIADLGLDVVAGTPAQMTSLVNTEMARWAALIKKQGIKGE
jgi:tripartite-type tricarboxylate transporter receptor subunit TctC